MTRTPHIYTKYEQPTDNINYSCNKWPEATHLNHDFTMYWYSTPCLLLQLHVAVMWCKSTSLTHWERVTHICVSKLTIIDSDNGLSPGRRQAIIWTNAVILLIGPIGTYFNEFVIEIHTFLFLKIHLKMSSGKWRPSTFVRGRVRHDGWMCWGKYS